MQPHWKVALVGGTAILALTADALAQNPPQPLANQLAPAAGQTPLYDPQQLPAQRGQIQQFTLTPRGDIDGLILTDGTEVKTPPHLSTQIAYAIKPGDTVTIHGLHAAALPLVQAVSITDDATGRMVIDNGPPGPGRGPPVPLPPIATVTGAARTAARTNRSAKPRADGAARAARRRERRIAGRRYDCASAAAGGLSLCEPAATGTDDCRGRNRARHCNGQGLGRAADRRLARAVEPRRNGPGTYSRAPPTAASRIWTARSATSVSRGIRPIISNPSKELPHALA